MKTKTFFPASGIIAASAALLITSAVAQDAAPALAPGPAQVLQLHQAKISASTINAYIKNSTTDYTLTAGQIIYLKQQGVADAVIDAMLSHRNVAAPTAPVTTSTVTAAPTVTYVQQPAVTSAPAPTVYYAPAYDYYPGYYPYYGWPYPALSFSFGFGGGHGGGFHGGGHGGGFHGGEHGGGGHHR